MKRRNKKASRSHRVVKDRKSSPTSLSPENLKTNFEVLAGICKMLEQCTGEKQVFIRMLNLMGKSVEFSRASLFLLNKSNNQMDEVASVGKKVDLIDFVRFDAGLGLSAWVAKEKRPILLSNLRRRRSGDGIRSFLTVPLLLNGELFGVMNFGHIRAQAFEQEDVNFLTVASIPITLSLERTFNLLEKERLTRELKQAFAHVQQLQEKLIQMEREIPTPKLLENLKGKIKAPLLCIEENAEFLLNCFSPKPNNKSSPQLRKNFNLQFKRGLKEIKNEANVIAKATEKLLKRSYTFDTRNRHTESRF